MIVPLITLSYDGFIMNDSLCAGENCSMHPRMRRGDAPTRKPCLGIHKSARQEAALGSDEKSVLYSVELREHLS